MRSILISHGGLLAAMLATSGCSTLSDQAPAEFHEAKTAIDDAQSADVDDQLPRAMEAAEQKYARALDLLDDSGSRAADGSATEADTLRKAAIDEAVAARDIAKGAISVVQSGSSYDANPGDFLAQQNVGASAERLAGENTALKEQNAQLQKQVTDLTANNANLANRPVESEIPADFRVAKPIAYFGSGSVALNQDARREIQEMAEFLKSDTKFAVSLEGFADPRGSAELNKQLAEKRIQSVANEFRRLGIEDARIATNPVGETSETATGGAGAMQLDRKVVAKISVAH